MIQTESPYFQPAPPAPTPFTAGIFANDPTFEDCTPGSSRCGLSWAVRIIDSSTLYFLGAGLYSWFYDYSQDCLLTEDCQQRGVYIEESSDIWLYNIATKAIVEMVSPMKETPTYAKDNVNGFLSSILAWLGGAEKTSGKRHFPGFQIYTRSNWFSNLKIPDVCKNALIQTITCEDTVSKWTRPAFRGSLGNITLTDLVCDPTCTASLSKFFNSVENACATYDIDGLPPTFFAGYMWQGVNETCLKNTDGAYCNGKLC